LILKEQLLISFEIESPKEFPTKGWMVPLAEDESASRQTKNVIHNRTEPEDIVSQELDGNDLQSLRWKFVVTIGFGTIDQLQLNQFIE
jgi:hypothetical protein